MISISITPVNTQLLKRPGIGKAGRPIRLKANFVPLQLPNDGDIYHYDVVIMPDKCPRGVNQEVVAKMVQEYQKIFKAEKPVFDGKKNLYSKRPLPIGNVTVRNSFYIQLILCLIGNALH